MPQNTPPGQTPRPPATLRDLPLRLQKDVIGEAQRLDPNLTAPINDLDTPAQVDVIEAAIAQEQAPAPPPALEKARAAVEAGVRQAQDRVKQGNPNRMKPILQQRQAEQAQEQAQAQLQDQAEQQQQETQKQVDKAPSVEDALLNTPPVPTTNTPDTPPPNAAEQLLAHADANPADASKIKPEPDKTKRSYFEAADEGFDPLGEWAKEQGDPLDDAIRQYEAAEAAADESVAAQLLGEAIQWANRNPAAALKGGAIVDEEGNAPRLVAGRLTPEQRQEMAAELRKARAAQTRTLREELAREAGGASLDWISRNVPAQTAAKMTDQDATRAMARLRSEDYPRYFAMMLEIQQAAAESYNAKTWNNGKPTGRAATPADVPSPLIADMIAMQTATSMGLDTSGKTPPQVMDMITKAQDQREAARGKARMAADRAAFDDLSAGEKAAYYLGNMAVGMSRTIEGFAVGSVRIADTAISKLSDMVSGTSYDQYREAYLKTHGEEPPLTADQWVDNFADAYDPGQDAIGRLLFGGARDLGDELANTPAARLAQSDPSLAFYEKGGVLSQGIGSMLAFPPLMKAIRPGTGKLSSFLAAAGAGVPISADGFYRAAIADGASKEQAELAMLMGMAVGTSEGLPIERMLGRAQKLKDLAKYAKAGKGQRAYQTLVRVTRNAAAGTVEEGLQEGFQTFGENLSARLLYDENRDLFEGVMEAAQTGGLLGSVFSGMASANGWSQAQIDAYQAAESEADRAKAAADLLGYDVENMPDSGQTATQRRMDARQEAESAERGVQDATTTDANAQALPQGDTGLTDAQQRGLEDARDTRTTAQETQDATTDPAAQAQDNPQPDRVEGLEPDAGDEAARPVEQAGTDEAASDTDAQAVAGEPPVDRDGVEPTGEVADGAGDVAQQAWPAGVTPIVTGEQGFEIEPISFRERRARGDFEGMADDEAAGQFTRDKKAQRDLIVGRMDDAPKDTIVTVTDEDGDTRQYRKAFSGSGDGRWVPHGTMPDGSPSTGSFSYGVLPRGKYAFAPLQAADKPKYDYASTQINMPRDVAARLVDTAKSIQASALAGKGIETEPHLTVKYGLKTEDPAAVQAVADNFKPFTVRLGRTGVFPASESSDGADVLYVRADSPELKKLNKAIGEAIDADDTFPDYNPHVTLAYLKPEESAKYKGKGFAAGTEIRVDSFVATDRNGNPTTITLGGTDAPAIQDNDQAAPGAAAAPAAQDPATTATTAAEEAQGEGVPATAGEATPPQEILTNAQKNATPADAGPADRGEPAADQGPDGPATPAPTGPDAADQPQPEPPGDAAARTDQGSPPSKSRQIVDTRLQETSAPDDALGLIKMPETLSDGDPLLQETVSKTQAVVTEDSMIAKRGIMAPGTYERSELHRVLLDHFAAQAVDEDQPRVIFTGGGSGAGKSTVVNDAKHQGLIPQDLLEVNADNFKALIPEFDAIVAAGDGRGALTVHEESSVLAKQLLKEMLEQKKTFIFDATLANPAKSIALMTDIKKRGYQIDLYAVTVDPYEAAVRASARAKRSGRYVPNRFILEAHKGFHEGLQQYLDAADNAVLIENTRDDETVTLLTKDAENGTQVLNKTLLQAILKRKELAPDATNRQELIQSYPVLRPSDQDVARNIEQIQARQAARTSGPESDRQPDEGGPAADRGAGEGPETAGDDPVPRRGPDRLDQEATDDPSTRSDDPGPGATADTRGAGVSETGTGDTGQADQADDDLPAEGLPARGEIDGGADGEADDAGSPASDEGSGTTGDRGGEQDGGSDRAAAAESDRAEPAGYDPELVPRPNKGSDSRNHHIDRDETVAPASNKGRFKANMEALRTLAAIRETGRYATAEEKRILARYTGFGWANFESTEGKAMMVELETLLTKAEIKAVKASTLNAHYTRPDVIAAVWDMVEQLGFKGGKVLEPSAGIGHFIGVMPEHLADRSRTTQIELDQMSGEITRLLYPESDVEIDGFQHVPIDNSTVDLAISNVPFGGKIAGAKDYPGYLIHDYFFARSLDKVKPGGLVAFITSNGTMDKGETKVRRQLQERADLVASVRLPGNTFGRNANTDVTTDIIILRKHTPKPWAGRKDVPDWTEAVKVGEDPTNGEPIVVNNYYAQRPEHVLGTHTRQGSRYGAGMYALRAGKSGKMSEVDAEIAKLPAIAKTLPEGVMNPQTPEVGEEAGLEAPKGSVELSHVQQGDDWYQVIDGKLQPAPWLTQKNHGAGWEKAISAAEVAKRKKYAAMFFKLAEVRDAVIQSELTGEPKKTQDAKRKRLNQVYARVLKATKTASYTSLNRPPRSQGSAPFAFLQEDPAYYKVMALEREVEGADPKTGKEVYTYEKQAIFKQATVAKIERPTSADNAVDAIGITLNFDGRLDVGTVADLMGIAPEQAAAELRASGQAFLDPASGQWMTRAQYVSGPVVRRLKEAKAAVAEGQNEFKDNVTALEAAQPERITLSDVTVGLASRWVPPEVMSAWASETLGDGITVKYIQDANTYVIDGGASEAAQAEYGTDRASVMKLLEKALRNQQHKVYDKVDKDTRVLNKAATEDAARATRKLGAAFQQWIKTNQSMITVNGKEVSAVQHTEDVYNDVNNGVSEAEYTGEHMTFPGLSKDVWLKPYRTRAVARILQDGGAVLAHGVGSGKTLTMIMAAHELKRTGLRKKSMIVVKKPTVTDFASATQMAYPTANALVSTDKSFSKGHRARFMNQIAVGDWDMVIITQEQFTKLAAGSKIVKRYFERQLDQLESAIRASKADSGQEATTKQLEKSKAAMEAKQARMLEDLSKNQDQGLTFEELGVDELFIDEAHDFKKIPINSRMQNIKGLPNDTSQRAMHLDMVSEYLQSIGGGTVAASGTPITNTVAEAFVMLKLARPDVLATYGIRNFDDFANTFGEAVEAMEFTYAMKFKFVTRFNKLVNLPELVQMIRQGFDVAIGNDKLGLDVPRVKGGAPTVTAYEPTRALTQSSAKIMAAVGKFEDLPGNERRDKSWVPIVAMGYGTAAALDPRLVDPGAADENGSKVNRALKEVLRIYKSSTKTSGTQMIFADRYRTMNTEKLDAFIGGEDVGVDIDESLDQLEAGEERQAVDEEAEQDKHAVGDFNLYHDIRTKLIKAGVPKAEIAIIGDYNTDNQREKLFNDVNAGKVRIVLGSTEKMGVGVNAQKKLIALHALDPPRDMTPAKVEQRLGRIVRQGHEKGHPSAKEVEVFYYGVVKSMDAGVWQKIEQKGRFIDAMLSGNVGTRTMEDLSSDMTAGFADFQARLSGDPRALRVMDLTHRIDQLKNDKAGYESEITAAIKQKNETRAQIKAAKDRRKRLTEAKPDVVEQFSGLNDYRAALEAQLADLAAQHAGDRKDTHERLRDVLDRYGLPGGVFKEKVAAPGKDPDAKPINAYVWRRAGSKPKVVGKSLDQAAAELRLFAAENPMPAPASAPPFSLTIEGVTYDSLEAAAGALNESLQAGVLPDRDNRVTVRLAGDSGGVSGGTSGGVYKLMVDLAEGKRISATAVLANPEGLPVSATSHKMNSGEQVLTTVVLDAESRLSNMIAARDNEVEQLESKSQGIDRKLDTPWDQAEQYDKAIKELDDLKQEMAAPPAPPPETTSPPETAEATQATDAAADDLGKMPTTSAGRLPNRGMTHTDAFQAWFKGSKVVDEQGKPLVVYHGTGHAFGEFGKKAKAIGDPVLENAYFFTNDPTTASGFAFTGGKAPRVIPAYLALKNPLVVDMKGLAWPDAVGIIQAVNDIPSADDFESVAKKYANATLNHLADESVDANVRARLDAIDRAKRVYTGRHDGLILRGIGDQPGGGGFAGPISVDIDELIRIHVESMTVKQIKGLYDTIVAPRSSLYHPFKKPKSRSDWLGAVTHQIRGAASGIDAPGSVQKAAYEVVEAAGVNPEQWQIMQEGFAWVNHDVHVALSPTQIKSAFSGDVYEAARPDSGGDIRAAAPTPDMPGARLVSADRLPDQDADRPAKTKAGEKLVNNLRKDTEGQRYGLRSINDYLIDAVQTEMREGLAQVTGKMPAFYMEGDYHLIRAKTNTFQLVFHEVGHALSALMRDEHAEPLRGLGPALITLSKAPGSFASAHSIEEGFAEYIRRLVSDPASLPVELRKRIGRFLTDNYPGIQDSLADARLAMEAHLQRSDDAKFRSYMKDRPKFKGAAAKAKLALKWHSFLYNVSAGSVLDTRVHKRMFDALEAYDKTVANSIMEGMKGTAADFRTAHQMTLHAGGEADRAFYGSNKGQKGLRVAQTGEANPFIAILEDLPTELRRQFADLFDFDQTPKAAGHGNYLYLTDFVMQDVIDAVGKDNWEAFQVYGWRRAAMARYDAKGHAYMGMTEDQTPSAMRDKIQDAEAAHPDWVEQFERITKYMNQALLVPVLSGEIDAASAVQIASAYGEDYWPLPRSIGGQFSKRKLAGDAPTAGIDRAYGSPIPFAEVLDAVDARLRQSLDAYYHNRMILAIARAGQQVSKSEAPLPVRAAARRIMVPLRLDTKKIATLELHEQQEIIADYVNQRTAAELNTTVDAMPDEAKVRPVDVEIAGPGYDVWKRQKPAGVRVVSPTLNGERVFYEVQDPLLFEFISRVDDSNKNRFTKIVTGIANTMAQTIPPWKRGITQTWPFTLWNVMARDPYTAMMLGDKAVSRIPFGHMAKAMVNRLLLATGTGGDVTAEVPTEMLSRTLDATMGKKQKGIVDSFFHMLNEGYTIEGWGQMDGLQRATAILKRSPGLVMNTLAKPTDLINWVTGARYASQFTEGLSREGAYLAAKQEGMNDEQAQAQYDWITGNFIERSGSNTLGAIFRAAGFMNPGLQIMYQTYHRASTRTGDFGVKLGLMSVVAGVAAAVNFLFLDEEDKRQMRERSDEDRLRYMQISSPFKGVRIRMPFDYGPSGGVMSIAWNTVERQLLDEPIDAKEAAWLAIDRGLSLPGITDLLGPHLKGLIEVKTNYSFFFDEKIVPAWLEQTYPRTPELQAYDDMPTMYTWLGKKLDTSPIKVQYAIRQSLTSSATDLIRAVQMVWTGKPGRDPLLSAENLPNLPWVGRIFTRDQEAWRAKSMDEIAVLDEAYRAAKATRKHVEELIDPEAAADLHGVESSISRSGKLIRTRENELDDLQEQVANRVEGWRSLTREVRQRKVRLEAMQERQAERLDEEAELREKLRTADPERYKQVQELAAKMDELEDVHDAMGVLTKKWNDVKEARRAVDRARRKGDQEALKAARERRDLLEREMTDTARQRLQQYMHYAE